MQIQLTQGKFARIDSEDFGRVSESSWYFTQGYAVMRKNKRQIQLGRYIMNTPEGLDVDHINHDRLDNRKSNLRNCTTAQNLRNMKPHVGASSVYKGVSWEVRRGKWRAQINKNGSRCSLGYFVIETDAAYAYNRAAIELYGEFALLNVIVSSATLVPT